MLSTIRLLTGILLFSLPGVILFAQGKPAERKVTLNKQLVPITEILEEIEKQSGMFFSYESSLFESISPASLRVDDKTVEDCLKLLFDKLPVMYQVNGQSIILKKKPRQVVISGFVREAISSEPLIGASVYQATHRKGTATNNYGFFSLSLEPGDINLQVSYIGYQPQLISFPFMERDTLITIELGAIQP